MDYKTAIGRSKERNENSDCAVIALAIATNCSYDLAHRKLASTGRKNGKGTINNHDKKCVPLNKAIVKRGFSMTRVSCKAKTLMSLSRSIKTKNTLIVYSGGKRGPNHVSVYKDGVCEDWAAYSKKPIVSVYVVKRKKKGALKR